MRWRIILYCVLLNSVLAKKEEDEPKTRIVILDEGGVEGTKYWDGDFYEFFGVPYAEAPTGRDRYQAPLPPKPWKSILASNVKNIVCHQSFYTDEGEEFFVSGEDDCLLMNLYVPEIASKDNLVPVVAYIHSGAFAGGNGNMARFHYLARHDIIVVSFNYRVGALGFACLGNKEIPGNAGLKDQLAALKWIKKNIKKFGGDPNKITLAGFSVGASMAELLSLTKAADGLIDQLILDSASVLSPFVINRDPISTATNLAYAMGYNGTKNLDDLTEFYLNATVEVLAAKSLNFFLSNSTFGFVPCIENVHKGIKPLLTESPMDTLRKGKRSKIPVLIGFSNMEGISRTIKFGEWREKMTEDFSKFIPVDLVFDSEETQLDVIKKIKKRYFKGEEVNSEKLQNYIDYFSDAMFKYSIMKSLKLRAATTQRKMYLYEFSYLGKLNVQHNYMDRVKGASHRDQTAYVLDFFGFTNSDKDLEMRNRMTLMWADFVKYGDPTAYESAVVNYKWLPYTNENQNYLQINKKPTMKRNLFVEGFKFWDKLYEEYYWNPTAPKQPKPLNIKKKQVEAAPVKKPNKSNDPKPSDDTKNKANEDTATDSIVVNEKKEEGNEGNKENKVADENKKPQNIKKKQVKAAQVEKTNNSNDEKLFDDTKNTGDGDTLTDSKILNEKEKESNEASKENKVVDENIKPQNSKKKQVKSAPAKKTNKSNNRKPSDDTKNKSNEDTATDSKIVNEKKEEGNEGNKENKVADENKKPQNIKKKQAKAAQVEKTNKLSDDTKNKVDEGKVQDSKVADEKKEEANEADKKNKVVNEDTTKEKETVEQVKKDNKDQPVVEETQKPQNIENKKPIKTKKKQNSKDKLKIITEVK